MLLLAIQLSPASLGAKRRCNGHRANSRHIIKVVDACAITDTVGTLHRQLATTYRFRILVRPPTMPQVVYWRPAAGLRICSITRHVGSDTLYLVAMPGGKFRTPPSIPDSARFTLFFKWATPDFQCVSVHHITNRTP